MKHAPIRHRLEYAFYLVVKGLLRALPHRAARAVGAALGTVAWALDRRHRQVAFSNLEVLTELTPAARRTLTRRCFAHFGSSFTDLISSSRFSAVDFCARLSIEGFEHLVDAEAAGKGVVVMSPHIGFWEYTGYVAGIYGGPLHVVIRPLDNPYLDRELSWLRTRFGNQLIAKHGAARAMLETLRSGGRLGILIDQRVRPQDGIELPFFGRPALTSPVLAKLALRTGAPVVPFAGYPEPKGRYRVIFQPPIWPHEASSQTNSQVSSQANSSTAAERQPGEERPGKRDDTVAVRELTARYLAATEAEIRTHPEQWLWLHRRWRPAAK